LKQSLQKPTKNGLKSFSANFMEKSVLIQIAGNLILPLATHAEKMVSLQNLGSCRLKAQLNMSFFSLGQEAPCLLMLM